MKFAILGSTYARALGNAAQRRGVPYAPEAFESIAKQPLAKLDPHASAFVRGRQAPSELPMTSQRQGLQQMLHQTPWATDEHSGVRGGSEHAVNRFNELLDQSGRSHVTPVGQPDTHQRIMSTFGPPQPARRSATQARPAPSGPTYQLPGGFTAPVGRNIFELMDETGRGGTHVGPAPAPASGRVAPRMAPPPSAAGVQAPGQHMSFDPSRRAGTLPGASGHAAPNAGTAVFRKVGAALPTAVGLGIPLAVGGGLLASKPGIQANMKALTEGGSTQERDVSGELPEPAINHASAIHQALLSHGLDPASVRMGIDAPPGSGKTTLARALAQQAGMKHYGLDWEPGNWWKSTIGLGRNVESTPRAPHAGEVLEHYMLGRTYDPELFDAMVHIHRDPEVLKQQLQHRGHGAYIGDMMNLQKSLGVADLGFNTLAGDAIDLGDGVQMKLRPREGWGNAVDQRLMQLGIDPTGLSRHEKLLSLHAGKRETGAGWTPYVKNPLSTGETIALGASVPLGIMAARALRSRPL